MYSSRNYRSLPLVIVGVLVNGISLTSFFSAPFKAGTDAARRCGFPANQTTFGVLSSLYSLAYTFGALVGPSVGGTLHDMVGFRWAATIAACFEMVLAALLLIGTGIGRRQSASRLLHSDDQTE